MWLVLAVLLSAFASGPAAAAETELLILITPKIVKPASNQSATRLAGFGTFIAKPLPPSKPGK